MTSWSLALLSSKDVEVVSIKKCISDVDIPMAIPEWKSWLFRLKNSLATTPIQK